MMGRLNRDQGQLFYCFNLDEVVPEDHLVRAIAAVLDLSWVCGELAPHYSAIGRPSIDPVLMIRMLIVGYVFAIRSERALCREVQVNLAYRLFCGLGIEDKIPDHSVFSRARNERFHNHDVFRRVFERVVAACIAAGLVGGEGFAVDASLIEADANKSRSIPGSQWNKDIDPERATRAVSEYLATLDDAAYGAATSVIPKFVRPMDWCAEKCGVLCLRRQLSHRCEVWDHHGRRGLARHSSGRGRRLADDACAHPRVFWHSAAMARRRHSLWLSPEPRLARQHTRDRAARPGHRQIAA